MYGFIMARIELYDTGQNSLSHWKARIWLPMAFKKKFCTQSTKTHWSQAQFQKEQPTPCKTTYILLRSPLKVRKFLTTNLLPLTGPGLRPTYTVQNSSCTKMGGA